MLYCIYKKHPHTGGPLHPTAVLFGGERCNQFEDQSPCLRQDELLSRFWRKPCPAVFD